MSIREEIMRRVMYKPESLSVQELQQSIQSGVIPGYIGIPILQEKIKQQKQAAQGQGAQVAPDQPPVAQQVMQEAQGIEGLPGDVPMEHMAGGGIVAFDDGGKVDTSTPFSRWWGSGQPERNEQRERQELQQELAQKYGPYAGAFGFFRQQSPEQRTQAQSIMANLNTMSPDQMRVILGKQPQMKPTTPAATAAAATAPDYSGFKPDERDVNIEKEKPPVLPPAPVAQSKSGIAGLSDVDQIHQMFGKAPEMPTMDTTRQEANVAERRKEYESGKESNKWEAITQAGLAMMAGSSPYALQNIGAGGIAGLKQYTSGQKDLRDLYKEIADADAKVEAAQNEGKMRPYLAAVKERDEKIGMWKVLEEGKAKLRVAEMYGNKQLAAYDRAELNANITMLKQNIASKENILKDLTKTDQERAQAKAELQRDYAALKELTRLDIGPKNFTVGKDGVLRAAQ